MEDPGQDEPLLLVLTSLSAIEAMAEMSTLQMKLVTCFRANEILHPRTSQSCHEDFESSQND